MLEKIKNIFKKNKNPDRIMFQRPEKKGFFERRNNFYLRYESGKITKFLKQNYIPYSFILFIVLVFVIIFLIVGPVFKVSNIYIFKNDSLTDLVIAYESIEDFRNDSIFKIEEKEILEKMQQDQKNIKSIDLTIIYPKTLKIKVESYKPKFNVTINEKNYILLENGSLVPTKQPLEDKPNLEIIAKIDNFRILDYKIIFDENYIKKIEEIPIMIKENIAYVNITGLKYYQKERELHVILDDQTRLLFSLEDISIYEQIRLLSALDKEHSKISNHDKYYIDLRIKGKVFYCSIGNDTNKRKEATCKNNLEYIYSQL